MLAKLAVNYYENLALLRTSCNKVTDINRLRNGKLDRERIAHFRRFIETQVNS